MPKVFYTGHSRESPPAEREWPSDGTASEAETDLEAENVVVNQKPRTKTVHQRTESMDSSPHLVPPTKRTRRAGNAIMRQREPSREIRDATGQRPLQKACSRGDFERVKTVLERNNPDLQDRDYAGTTALHTAALQGDERIVSALLSAGAVPDVRSGPEELDTPLMDAAANGSLPVVKLLLKYGADPRITNAMGRIALDFVEEEGDNDGGRDEVSGAIIKVLTKRMLELRRAGAPIINSPSHPQAVEGLYPPGFASVQRPSAPAFLDLTKRSTRQEIAEHASMGDLEYVGSALERGWRPTLDALVKAARYGHADIVGLLLAFGLDANSHVDGTTAVREAIKRNHLATVKLLLESGASIDQEDKRYVTDLPAWDELRGLVLGVTPEPAPEPARETVGSVSSAVHTKRRDSRSDTSREENKVESESNDKQRPKDTQSPSISAPSISSGTSARVPPSAPAVSSHRSIDTLHHNSAKPDTNSLSYSNGDKAPIPDSSNKIPIAGNKANQGKPSQSESKPFSALTSDIKLSKFDLRSIKPKKRNRQSSEGASPTISTLESTTVPTSDNSPAELTSSSTNPKSEYSEDSKDSISVQNGSNMVPGMNGAGDLPQESIRDNEAVTQGNNGVIPTAFEGSSTPFSKDPSPLTVLPPKQPISSTIESAKETNKDKATKSTAKKNDPVVVRSTAANHAPNRAESPSEASRESPTRSEIWAERSQELRELAERKEQARRDREARMLESIAQEERRRSESEMQVQDRRRDSASSIKSSPADSSMNALENPSSFSSSAELDGAKAPSIEPVAAVTSGEDSPSSEAAIDSGTTPHAKQQVIEENPEKESRKETSDQSKLVSVASFPWAVRKMAYSGLPQAVAPLYIYNMNGKQSYVDIQVSLATGNVNIHTKYPGLNKTVISSHQKQLLWPFCRPWLCRSQSTVEEINSDYKKFVDMPLCWISAAEVDEKLLANFSQKLSKVAIQLDLKPPAPKPIISSKELPLWWQMRITKPGRAW